MCLAHKEASPAKLCANLFREEIKGELGTPPVPLFSDGACWWQNSGGGLGARNLWGRATMSPLQGLSSLVTLVAVFSAVVSGDVSFVSSLGQPVGCSSFVRELGSPCKSPIAHKGSRASWPSCAVSEPNLLACLTGLLQGV